MNLSEPRILRLPSGKPIPVLGQGTWRMGESHSKRKAEVNALQLGLDLGMSLIDTAEMYGEGGAEEVVGEAIAGRRSEVFLVSKVYPHNATRRGAIEACHRSLRRLKTDYLDLYLLHWREAEPLAQTLEAFQQLQQDGLIRDYGVSNFDLSDMKEAWALPGGNRIATNQVLYNLLHRGIEWDLLPWCRRAGIPMMAYSPVDLGTDLLSHPQLKQIADRRHATTAQIALAWLLHQDVIVIPKASHPKHVRENAAALTFVLSEEDLEELDLAFPPPRSKQPLAMR